jgi:hypothetical protein
LVHASRGGTINEGLDVPLGVPHDVVGFANVLQQLSLLMASTLAPT